MRNFNFYVMAALLAGLIAAAPGSATAENKIGVVSMQTVINDSQAGKDAIVELQKKAEGEKAKLEIKAKEFKTLQENYEQKKLFSRPEVLEKMEQEIINKKREIELYQEDTRRSLQRSQARITGEVIKNAKEIISEYAKQNGFTLIVERSEGISAMAGLVLYANESIDLTKTVIELFNDEYKASRAGKK